MPSAFSLTRHGSPSPRAITCLQVATQLHAVAEDAGVVHHDGVVDAMGLCNHGCRGSGVVLALALVLMPLPLHGGATVS